MRPISSEDDQTVQFHLFEIILHGLDFIDIVFLDYPHFFKGLAGGSKNRSPQRQNAGKIRLFHAAAASLYQPAIAILYAINLNIFAPLFI